MKEPLSIGFNVTFDDAIKEAKKRKVVLPDVYYGELQGVARQRAFSIAGIASLDQLQAVKDSLYMAMSTGRSFEQWKELVEKTLFGLPEHRLDNIFRTNLQGSYMAGRWQQFRRNKDTRPFLMYDAINDSRVRPAHLALDNIIRRIDDKFWKTHSPPNGYRCRCSLISLTEAQAKARSGKGKGLDNPAQLEDGTPAGPDAGWEYNPAGALTGLKEAAAKKAKKSPKLAEPLREVSDAVPINSWRKVGDQKGSNPGGTFLSDDGVEWYVKFPDDKDRAYNEVLAGKLYQAAGVDVPDMIIVRREGKIGLASRVVKGLERDQGALTSGKVEGVHEGFAVDAWLANWDVVGLSYDNLLVRNGKAFRVDTGGALLYRAQGMEKGAAFGGTVTEIDSLRSAAVNRQSAAVFGRITDGELKASAARVLSLDDDLIRATVDQYGPGNAAQKSALADLLIARKNDIGSRFPDVAPKIRQAVESAISAEKSNLSAKIADLDDAVITAVKGINHRAKLGGLIESKDLDRVKVAAAKYQEFLRSAVVLEESSLGAIKEHYSSWLLKLEKAIVDGEGMTAAPIDGMFSGIGQGAIAINRALMKPKFEPWMFDSLSSFTAQQVLDILKAAERTLERSDYLTTAKIPENNAKAKIFDKMPAEYKRALWSWTPSHIYSGITPKLLDRAYKGIQPDKAITDYEALINAAIKAAPKESIHVGRATRGMFHSRSDAKEYFTRMQKLESTGEVYQLETISSSSKGDTPAFDKSLYLHIQSKTGVYIQPISNYKNENEVLFGTEQKFLVTGTEEKNGKFHVYIKEI